MILDQCADHVTIKLKIITPQVFLLSTCFFIYLNYSEHTTMQASGCIWAVLQHLWENTLITTVKWCVVIKLCISLLKVSVHLDVSPGHVKNVIPNAEFHCIEQMPQVREALLN